MTVFAHHASRAVLRDSHDDNLYYTIGDYTYRLRVCEGDDDDVDVDVTQLSRRCVRLREMIEARIEIEVIRCAMAEAVNNKRHVTIIDQ